LFYEVPREPFELPDLTEGFSPDDLDVKILRKKQEKSVSSLKDLSSLLGVSFKDVLYYTQAHVIGKGLIKGYNVYLYKPDFRLEVTPPLEGARLLIFCNMVILFSHKPP
jgi:DNA-binding Lrp family transcriptional regulator